MIKSIKSKSLDSYWFKGRRLDIPPKAARKVQRVLKLLDKIETDAELFETFNTPGFKLQRYHERKYKDDWEIWISGNYRMLFVWDGKNTREVEYTDDTH